MRRLDGAILTPGDPCPAGRCPECGSLAYPVGGKYIAAPDMLKALRALEPFFDNDSKLLAVYATEIAGVRAAITKAEAGHE